MGISSRNREVSLKTNNSNSLKRLDPLNIRFQIVIIRRYDALPEHYNTVMYSYVKLGSTKPLKQ